MILQKHLKIYLFATFFRICILCMYPAVSHIFNTLLDTMATFFHTHIPFFYQGSVTNWASRDSKQFTSIDTM